jgi:hypothetical protein
MLIFIIHEMIETSYREYSTPMLLIYNLSGAAHIPSSNVTSASNIKITYGKK